MNIKILALLLFFCHHAQAQNTVSGIVKGPKGKPVSGANVFIDGSYDGASTASDGTFKFETTETGNQVLSVSFIGFETYTYFAPVRAMKNLQIILKDDLNALDTVVLTAGTFEAGGQSSVAVLKPLDIVTTANALGDVVGAFQTLPGTTTVAEDGRLFVRGGDAGETQIFIDGLRVFTPYTPTINNVPTRGRYSPFLFDGISFSTGGYSAEYGQALSSVLLLETIDEPSQNKTDISVMSVGGGLGLTRKWEKSSLSLSTSYINLAPYLAVYNDRNDWVKPFQSFAGEAVYRYKTNTGLWKAYTAIDGSKMSLIQEDINVAQGVNFALKNTNLYTNISYTGQLNDTWKIFWGGSYTLARNTINTLQNTIKNKEKSAHLKFKLKKRFSNQFKLNFGAEHFSTDFNENFSGFFDTEMISQENVLTTNIAALFAESAIIFSKQLAMKLGVRATYTDIFKTYNVAPRASIAYKTGANSQFSIAYGDFFQNPSNTYLKYTQELSTQKTQHFIANYQYSHNGRILRLEGYSKIYNSLITFDTSTANFDSNYANNGSGYAQGVDLFFRDNTSVKNLDYWISYSFLDTQRKYLNYPEQAMPSFANTHNFSVVTKYFIEKWKSQVGLAYQYSSGRPYTNPNVSGFLQERTKPFNNLSLNWAYLISQQKILYFSVNNVLDFENINGYQYANAQNTNGVFERRPLTPAADQFFFIGFFWTISDDKSSNQLDNL